VTGPKVSIVVVNWNGIDYLRNCLRSLRDHAPEGTQVVVVDNGSTDGSTEMVAKLFPEVDLIANGGNEGWVAGAHKGAARSRGEILFLLNNDTEIAPGCIEAVLRRFEDPGVSIVGCHVRDLADRGLEHEAGMSIDRFAFMVPFPFRRRDLPPFYVSGTGLAVRSKDVRELGLFDDRYEVYAEDIDICWRYRLAGKHVTVAEDAVLYHAIGATVAGGVRGDGSHYSTSRRRVYLRERNSLATMLKNYSLASLLYVLPAYLSLLIGEVVASIITLRPSWGAQLLRALAWNAAHLPTTLALRREVQHRRRIPDRTLPFDNRLGKWLALRAVGVPRFVR
jgi:GT2 family glycosyltransferase